MHIQHVEQSIAMLLLELLHLLQYKESNRSVRARYTRWDCPNTGTETSASPLFASAQENSMPVQPPGTGPTTSAVGSTAFTACAQVRFRVSMSL